MPASFSCRTHLLAQLALKHLHTGSRPPVQHPLQEMINCRAEHAELPSWQGSPAAECQQSPCSTRHSKHMNTQRLACTPAARPAVGAPASQLQEPGTRVPRALPAAPMCTCHAAAGLRRPHKPAAPPRRQPSSRGSEHELQPTPWRVRHELPADGEGGKGGGAALRYALALVSGIGQSEQNS